MVGLLLICAPGVPFLHDLSQINTDMKRHQYERMIWLILQDQDLKNIKQIEKLFLNRKKLEREKFISTSPSRGTWYQEQYRILDHNQVGMDFGSGLYDRVVNEILSEIKLLCNFTLVIRIWIVLKNRQEN